MKFERRFGKRKRKNSKKGLVFVLLLVLALFLFFNIDSLLRKFFKNEWLIFSLNATLQHTTK